MAKHLLKKITLILILTPFLITSKAGAQGYDNADTAFFAGSNGITTKVLLSPSPKTPFKDVQATPNDQIPNEAKKIFKEFEEWVKNAPFSIISGDCACPVEVYGGNPHTSDKLDKLNKSGTILRAGQYGYPTLRFNPQEKTLTLNYKSLTTCANFGRVGLAYPRNDAYTETFTLSLVGGQVHASGESRRVTHFSYPKPISEKSEKMDVSGLNLSSPNLMAALEGGCKKRYGRSPIESSEINPEATDAYFLQLVWIGSDDKPRSCLFKGSKPENSVQGMGWGYSLVSGLDAFKAKSQVDAFIRIIEEGRAKRFESLKKKMVSRNMTAKERRRAMQRLGDTWRQMAKDK